nr:hypothetical protein [Tanacetum cinerariifolium]
MFDEYFNPPSSDVSLVLVAAAPRAVDLADSPMSTLIDQDAPSTSIPLTQEQEHSLIISQGFEESPKTPTFHDDPLHESLHEDSTSHEASLNMRQTHTSFEHLGRWTKDHPRVNVISDPSRFIYTRKQLQTDAMCNSIDTPLGEKSKLDKDLQGKPVDVTLKRGMIRSIMYLTSSRPDLTYAVCLCAQYQAKLIENYLNAIKRIFRYLKDTRRNTSGSAQFLGDKLVSWSSKKQKSTVISSKEIPLYYDNKSVIALCCNNVQHLRANHIDVRYHFIKEQVKNEIVELYFRKRMIDGGNSYPGQDFDALPTDEEIMSFLRDLGHTKEINSLNDSMKDFYKTHPSGSGTVTKTALSVTKIKSSATSEGTSVKPWVPDVTEEESSEKDDDEDETKITDKGEGDKDEEIIYTTNQLYDNVDIRLNEPVDTNEGFVQEEELHHYKKKLLNSKRTILSKHKTALVDEHLDARIGATRDEFMNFILASITARITEQVKNQILPKEVSNFAPLIIQDMVTEPLELVILIDKIDKSESYLTAPKHRDCYEGLKKSYDLDKTFFSAYGKVYSLKRSRKDKDKDEDPSAGSDRGLNKRKTTKDAKPAIDSDMPHDQEKNQDNNDEPKKKVASKRDWFTKPTQPQEPIDPDWNISKTPKQGQNQSYMNINNLTQETLLGPSFKLLKGTRSNYAKLEYDFEESYKALSEKIDWENLEGGAYPFDLTKPLPLVKIGNHQKVPVDYFFNNDLKYLQGGISTMTYTTSLTKTKAAQYDLPCIEDMVPNIWSHVKVSFDKHALWGISH